MTEKSEQRMIAFRTHTRGDTLVRKGEEFTATEEEAHAYAARENPLAGPLEEDEEVGAPRRRSAPKARSTARSRRKAK
jgi:hypothetical protein